MDTPYGKIFTLKKALQNVECWNYSRNESATLPKGWLIRLEHEYDATHTTILASSDHAKDGLHVGGIELSNGCKGYRFIVPNALLVGAIGIELPDTFDLVGKLMAYESGEMDAEETEELFDHLRETGIGHKLQGHYSSRM